MVNFIYVQVCSNFSLVPDQIKVFHKYLPIKIIVFVSPKEGEPHPTPDSPRVYTYIVVLVEPQTKESFELRKNAILENKGPEAEVK